MLLVLVLVLVLVLMLVLVLILGNIWRRSGTTSCSVVDRRVILRISMAAVAAATAVPTSTITAAAPGRAALSQPCTARRKRALGPASSCCRRGVAIAA